MLREILAFFNLEPIRSRMNRDLRDMREKTSGWHQELAPWDHEEMTLLAANVVNGYPKKWSFKSKRIRGVFTSIYHEPLIVFNIRQYNKKNHLYRAANNKDEYVYRVKPSHIDVYYNGMMVAKIKNNQMFGNGGRRKIGRREIIHSPEVSIIIGEKEIGYLNATPTNRGFLPRVLTILQTPSPDEEVLFLTFVYLEMLRKLIKNK